MDHENLRALLAEVAERAADFRADAATRPHRPERNYAEMLARFDQPMPSQGLPARAVIAELLDLVDGGLANMVGPRFFGWVIGATSPAGVAADWLTSAWGQNVANAEPTPAASACEEIAGRWLLEALGLPSGCSVGFVTGATMANFTCLAAARGEVLRRVGWNVEANGLFDAPAVHVVLGAEAHSTVFSALRYLGFGAQRVIKVAADAQGRMRADAFAEAMKAIEGPSIVIAQAGHINSGAFDPMAEIADGAHAKGAWVHVDGAFGLWAAAVPEMAQLVEGFDKADSWATDGHKWLQTPHDCGYAVVRDATAHRSAMATTASYLPAGDLRIASDYTPELSRRGRGFATWAMLRHLGREGIASMVRRHCALARRMAERLVAEPGITIMNDVVLNQIAVRLGDGDKQLTERVIQRIQNEGVCFVAGAHWMGRDIVRISIIGENTTEADIEQSAAAIAVAWRAERGVGA